MKKRPKNNKSMKKASRSSPLAKHVVVRFTTRDFDQVVSLIESARKQVISQINKELVELYWKIGEFVSGKLSSAEWGEGIVADLANHIAVVHPDIKGFTRSNLFRMRQFYETYKDIPKVAPLVRQLSWTHNLLILARSKLTEEREFYLRMAVQERWSKRELERQLNGALFERVVLSPPKVSAPVSQMHPTAKELFKDAYLVDFLNLPKGHSEADLQSHLVSNLRHFLIELGGDFSFVGEKFRLQVGARDFFVDLLFFHRALRCLVAIELKIEQFEPSDLGQLQFYLEALDRIVKKPHEQPSIGVLLCATKDEEVVEFALSRTVSPALVAEYQTRLPDKKLLRAKLHEFYALAESRADAELAIAKAPPRLAKKKKPKKRR